MIKVPQRFGAQVLAVVVAASLGFTADAAAPSKAPSEPITVLPEHDLELIIAEREARRTLPMFWQLLALNPKYQGAFSVKAGFDTKPGHVDYMWIHDLKRDGDDITGVLDNEPVDLPNLHANSKVRVKQSRIIDWLILVGDREYGHFTTRVLIKHDRKMAAVLKDTLSANPLPPAFKNPRGH